MKKRRREKKSRKKRATQQCRKRNAEYESLDERDRRCVSKNRRGGSASEILRKQKLLPREMALVWRLTLTVQSRHVSQRSRFVLSSHRSIREKSASKMPLTKLSRYSRLFRFPVRKDFLWKRCFQKPVPFLYSTRYIYILFAGKITWRRFSKLRTFSLLESENQCLKKCSIIGMLSSRTPISTTHLSS